MDEPEVKPWYVPDEFIEGDWHFMGENQVYRFVSSEFGDFLLKAYIEHLDDDMSKIRLVSVETLVEQ